MANPLTDIFSQLSDPQSEQHLADDQAIENYVSEPPFVSGRPDAKPAFYEDPIEDEDVASFGPQSRQNIEKVRAGTVWGVRPAFQKDVDRYRQMVDYTSGSEDIKRLVRAMDSHPNFAKMPKGWQEQKAVGMMRYLQMGGSITKPTHFRKKSVILPGEYRKRFEELVGRVEKGQGATIQRDDEFANFRRPNYEKAKDPLLAYLGGSEFFPESAGESARKARVGKSGVDEFRKTAEGEEFTKTANDYIDSVLAGEYDESGLEKLSRRGVTGLMKAKKWKLFEYILHEEAKKRTKEERGMLVRFFGGWSQWTRTGPRTVAEGGRTLLTDPYSGVFAGEGFSITSEARERSAERTEQMHRVTRARQLILGEILPTGPREDAGVSEKIVLYGGQMIPDLAVSTVLFAAGTVGAKSPALGAKLALGYWWARITPDIRDRLRELGVDDNYAVSLAAAGGLASAYIEQMQIKKLLPKGVTGVTAKAARAAASQRIMREFAEGGKLWLLAKQAARRSKEGLKLGAKETLEEFLQAVTESGTAGVGDYLDTRLDGWTLTEEWKGIKKQTEQGAYAISFIILAGRGLPGMVKLPGETANLKKQAEAYWENLLDQTQREYLEVLEESEPGRQRLIEEDRPRRREQLKEGLGEPRIDDLPADQPAEREAAPVHPKPPAGRGWTAEELIEEDREGAEEISQGVSRSRFLAITGGDQGSTRYQAGYETQISELLREKVAAETAAAEEERQRLREEGMDQPALPVEDWAVPEEGGTLITRGGGRYTIREVVEKDGKRVYRVHDVQLDEEREFTEDRVYNIEAAVGEGAQQPTIPLRKFDPSTMELEAGDIVFDNKGNRHTVERVTRTKAKPSAGDPTGQLSVITTTGERLAGADVTSVVSRNMGERKPYRIRQWPRPDAAEEAEAAEAEAVAVDEAEVNELVGAAAVVESQLRDQVGTSGPVARRIQGLVLRAEMAAKRGDSLVARQLLNQARRQIAENRKPGTEPEVAEEPAEQPAVEPDPQHVQLHGRASENQRAVDEAERAAEQPAEQPEARPIIAADEREPLPDEVRTQLGPGLQTLIQVEPGELVESDMDPEAYDLISRLEREAVGAFENEEGVRVSILAEPGGIPARRRAGVYFNGRAYMVRESLDLKSTDTRDQALAKIRRNYQRVLAEELTHHLQDVDPETAQKLWEYSIAEDPDGVWNSLEEYAEKAGWELPRLATETTLRRLGIPKAVRGVHPNQANWDALSSLQIAEAQANYVADHMGDGLFWNRMAKKNRNLFQKILDAIRTLFSNLRGRTTVDPVTGKRRQVSGPTYRRTMDAVLGATAKTADVADETRAAVGEPLDYRAGRAIAALEGANRGNRPSTPIGLGREEYAKDKRHHVAIAADLIMDSGAKLDDYWAVVSGVYGPWKGIGSDRTNFYKQVNQYISRAKASRRAGEAPKGTKAAGGLHREFLVNRDPKVGQLAGGGAPYLIPSNMGDIRESMGKDYRTPEKIAEKQRDALSALNRLLEEHADPFSDYDSALRFMTDLYRIDKWAPSPPMNLLAMRKDPGVASALLGGLNEDQVANSEHGLAVAQKFRERLADGSMTADHTTLMAGWGILSRMLSPYIHESAAMHLMKSPVAQQIIRDAVRGKMKLEKRTDIKLHPATGKPDLDKNDKPVYYTFQSDPRYEKLIRSLRHMIPEGSPGRPGIANLNSFFREFLPLMQRKHPSGVTYLQRLHEIFADQSITGSEARRRIMMEMPPGNGIQSKVWSFLLLLTGRTDVLVIDRVQARNLWDDGSFSHISNLYDGFKADGISRLVNDFKAIPLYEALERSLEPIIAEVFERAGISSPSMGKFHWMSWNAASFQEAGHGSLDYLYGTINNDQILMEDAASTEGRYNFTEYGATYYPMDPITGEGHKILWDPGALGYAYEFKDVEEFKAFQSWIKTAGSFTSDRKLGRVQTGGESVLPLEWRLRTERGGPKLMKVNGLNPKAIPEVESRPWIFAEGVDLDAINERAGELDTVRYDADAGRSFTTRIPKPKRRTTARRAAGEEVSQAERDAARAKAEARSVPSVDPTVRGVSRQITEEWYLGGRNYPQKLGPIGEQAREAVALDFMGETKRLLDKAAAGQGYGSNLDTAIANELHNKWIDKAVASSHLPEAESLKIWEQTRQVIEAVRSTRGTVARMMRQMHDPEKVSRRPGDNVLPLYPIDRVDALTEAVVEGPTRYQVARHEAEAALIKAREKGLTKGVERQQQTLRNLEKRWNTAFRKLRDKLESEGMDISEISDIALDPVKAQQMLNRIEGLNQNFLDHYFHFKRNMALSALTTTGADVFSTVGFGAYAMGFERGMESLQNSARKMLGKEIDYDAATWAEFKDIMSAMGPAIRKAFKNSIMTLMTEKPVLQRYVDQSGQLTGRMGSLKTGGGFGWKWPGRLVRAFGYSRLLFTDEFAQTFIGYTEVGAMARRMALQSGIQSGTDAMKEYIEHAVGDFTHGAWDMGLDRARRATFQKEQGEIAEGVKKVAQSFRSVPYVGSGYLRFQMMFLNTPINILAESIKMSPLGIFALLLDFGFKRRSAGGTGVPDVSRRVMQQLVNGIAMLGFYYAYDPDDPIITGTQGVWSWDEKRQARRTIPAMSIKVPWSEDEKGNPLYLDYSRIEPVSLVFASMVDLIVAWKRGPDIPKKLELAAKQSALTLADVTLNKSYLKQLNDIQEIWTAHEEKKIWRMLADYQSRQAVTAIPNILKHSLKHGDEYFAQRTVHGVSDDEYFSRLAKRTIQRTELHRWWGEEMQDVRKYDDWGRPVKTSETIGFLSPKTWRMLVPAFVKRVDIFVGDEILSNYSFDNPDDERNTPRPQRVYVNAAGERVSMTDLQLNIAEQRMGTVARELTTMYTSHFSEEQRQNPTKEMADLVRESLAAGRTEARRFLVAHWNKDKPLPTDWEQVARDLHAKQILSKANAAASKTAAYKWSVHGVGLEGRAVHEEMKVENEKKAREAIDWLKLRGFSNDDIYFESTKRNRSKLNRRLMDQ